MIVRSQGQLRTITIVKLLVAAAALGLLACSRADRRPNVVVLVADDQAHGTLSALGHPFLETPSIDRIARGGTVFANAFVTTSLCSPARVSLLTGQWARVHGVVTNSQPLPPGAVTFASVLAGAGYETACFGKWHMGARPGARPGFETWASYDGQGVYRDSTFDVNGVPTPSRGFVDDVTTDYAIEFLRAPRQRPFLAYVGFKAAHGPREPDPRFASAYAELVPEPPPNADAPPPFPRRAEWDALVAAAGVPPEELRPPDGWAEGLDRRGPASYDAEQVERRRDYYRLIAALDENVGRILGALDELGLADGTIVLYASDHGFANGEHGRTGKRTAYEESMRTLLLLKDPRRAGGTVEQLALNVDVAPTLIELCGLDVPAGMQGRSLVPLLDGQSVEWRRDFLYEYYRESDFLRPWTWFAHAVPSILALRTDEPSKLIVYPGREAWTELYRLDADPWETDNVARSDPSAARMRARLAELEAELGPRPGGRAGR